MRLYLDTSIFSAYFDARTPERMQSTREFWPILKRHERLCSDLTQTELNQATAEWSEQLKALTREFRMIAIDDPMRELATAYAQAGVVPARYVEDALHTESAFGIAAAVYGEADVLVSWNFKHLVKRNTRLLVNSINAQRGLRSIEILAPPEL